MPILHYSHEKGKEWTPGEHKINDATGQCNEDILSYCKENIKLQGQDGAAGHTHMMGVSLSGTFHLLRIRE
jgi:hypothetical protein